MSDRLFVYSYGLLRLCHAEGYKVIMCIRSSEMEKFRSGSGGENTIKVEQLQLYTQRAAE